MSAAVTEATKKAVDETKQEMEAAQAAARAVADAQALRELEDRVIALQEQLAASTERLAASELGLTCGPFLRHRLSDVRRPQGRCIRFCLGPLHCAAAVAACGQHGAPGSL